MIPRVCSKLFSAPGALIAMVGGWMFLAACGGVSEPSTDIVQLGPGVRLISGPNTTDTAMARPAQPFVVEVRDSVGGFKPTSIIVGSTAAGSDSPFPSAVSVSGSPNDPGSFFDIIPLDTLGRATFWVRFGRKAGAAQVTVSGLGQTGRIEMKILPAHAAKIRAQPADTAAYVGKTYTLQATVSDQWDNDRTDPVVFTAGPGLTVSQAGVVKPTEIGRRSIKLTSGNVTGEALVSVPPLGTLVAISGPIYRESIVVFDLDGSNWRSLAQLSTYSQRTAPQWSPSGQELVFHNSTDQEGIKAYRVDMAGNVRRILGPDGPPAQIFPRFSRDGQWLFFSGGPGARFVTTWRARADGSSPMQLGPSVFEAYYHFDPSPSPDGSRVVYEEERMVVWRIRPVVRVLDVATRAITPLDLIGVSARWSPTGDRIAYVADEEGQVVLINPDGSNQRVISAPGRKYMAGLDWSPDGRWLVVRSGEFPRVELIRVDTGETLPLPFSALVEEPAWRPEPR
jgi:dipeptidyl aminopeptidase/acylaminoacyl peptidase